MVYPNTLQAVQNLPSPRGSERFQQKSFSAVCDDNPAYPPISQAARDQSTQERADQQPQKEQFLVRENPPFPPIHQAVKDHPNPDESVRLPEEGQSSDAGKGNISNPSKTQMVRDQPILTKLCYTIPTRDILRHKCKQSIVSTYLPSVERLNCIKVQWHTTSTRTHLSCGRRQSSRGQKAGIPEGGTIPRWGREEPIKLFHSSGS